MTGQGGIEMCTCGECVAEQQLDRNDSPVDSLVSLRWSSEPPTESGWYWLRSAPKIDDDGEPIPIEPEDDDAEIVLVRGDTDTCKKRALSVDGGKMLVENYFGVEWAGPIFPPAN